MNNHIERGLALGAVMVSTGAVVDAVSAQDTENLQGEVSPLTLDAQPMGVNIDPSNTNFEDPQIINSLLENPTFNAYISETHRLVNRIASQTEASSVFDFDVQIRTAELNGTDVASKLITLDTENGVIYLLHDPINNTVLPVTTLGSELNLYVYNDNGVERFVPAVQDGDSMIMLTGIDPQTGALQTIEVVDANQLRPTYGFDIPTTLTGETLASAEVNLRSEPDANSQLVESLQPSTAVEVIDQDMQNGWYKVRVDGQEGWIRGDLLAVFEPELTPTPESTIEVAILPTATFEPRERRVVEAPALAPGQVREISSVEINGVETQVNGVESNIYGQNFRIVTNIEGINLSGMNPDLFAEALGRLGTGYYRGLGEENTPMGGNFNILDGKPTQIQVLQYDESQINPNEKIAAYDWNPGGETDILFMRVREEENLRIFTAYFRPDFFESISQEADSYYSDPVEKERYILSFFGESIFDAVVVNTRIFSGEEREGPGQTVYDAFGGDEARDQVDNLYFNTFVVSYNGL